MISDADVKKLAELSRIAVTPEEVPALVRDLDAILGYVSTLRQAEVSDQAPVPDLENVVRPDDEPHAGGQHTEELLRAAPRTRGGYVETRQIISYDE